MNNKLLFCTFSLLLFTGCGAKNNEPGSSSTTPQSSSSISSSAPTSQALTLNTEHFTIPTEDVNFVQGTPSVAFNREKNASQLTMEAANAIYPIDRIWQYNQFLPHPELFCAEPSDAEFLSLANKLGGFRKNSYIHIEPDATAPTVQSGLMKSYYQRRWLESAGVPTAADNPGNVTIQRPDVVGTSGNKAFYLSNTYGLITVDYSNVPFSAPSASCAYTLPGNPQNFVITDQHLYAIISGLKHNSSAVLQFDITGAEPVYISGQAFDQQRIIDARLFNDTLALYLETYEAVTGDNINAPVAPSGVQTIVAPPYSKSIGYELKTLATLPVLLETNSEALLSQGQENPPLDSREAIEQTYRHSYFNSFLSASGEYVVVTESVFERHFDHYEQRSAFRCEEYQVTETPHHYCQTKWKRIENPDYQPPASPGIVQCNSDLASCLGQNLPRINRYIFQPDGQECHDSIRYNYSCLRGQTVTHQVPVFRRETKTQFSVFRFHDQQFVRLDNQLASLDGNSIRIEDRPFALPGRVQKHDHIQFQNDYLYVISDNKQNGGDILLNTLAIMGNSAMEVDRLSLSGNGNYSQLNAAYSDERIYISDGSRGTSGILTVSLNNPLAPRIETTIKMPTQLQQMIFAEDQVVGLGRVQFQGSGNAGGSYTIGSVTSFSLTGLEQNNVLLGGDYRYYTTPIDYDDQVLSYSGEFQRLILPYTVSRPLAGVSGPNYENRLSVISTQDSDVQEEATIALPEPADRAVNLNAENALAFSSEFIHHLNKDGTWSIDTIFDGAIPDSIYYSRNYPTQVQKYMLGNNIVLKLIDSPDKASGDLLDTQMVSRNASQVCFAEQLLFDRDRIVIVREAADHYISYQDCPSAHNEVAKEFIGYRITESALEPITDQGELETLYVQSRWNLICVTDMDEEEGEFLTGYTLDDVSDLQCFTYTQFIEHITNTETVD